MNRKELKQEVERLRNQLQEEKTKNYQIKSKLDAIELNKFIDEFEKKHRFVLDNQKMEMHQGCGGRIKKTILTFVKQEHF